MRFAVFNNWKIPERYVGKRITFGLKLAVGNGQMAGMAGTLLEVLDGGAFIIRGDNGKTVLVPNDMVLPMELESSDVQVVTGNVLQRMAKQ